MRLGGILTSVVVFSQYFFFLFSTSLSLFLIRFFRQWAVQLLTNDFCQTLIKAKALVCCLNYNKRICREGKVIEKKAYSVMGTENRLHYEILQP